MDGKDKYKCKGNVQVQLSACLIEEKAMKVNGRVDELHFVFSASARYRRVVSGQVYCSGP
jgi:hypothetical protein